MTAATSGLHPDTRAEGGVTNILAHRRYGTAIHGPDTEIEDGATERFLTGEFSTFESWCRDPRPFDAERSAGQQQINALFKPHEENVLKQMQAMWDREGQ